MYEVVDIHVAPGQKVFYLDENGYESEREYARKFLSKHQELTIWQTDIGRWRTDFQFVECPNVWFNSVMFGVKKNGQSS